MTSFGLCWDCVIHAFIKCLMLTFITELLGEIKLCWCFLHSGFDVFVVFCFHPLKKQKFDWRLSYYGLYNYFQDAIEECRKLCGGHVYLSSSGLPEIFAVYVPACTYKGDNVVLHLQVCDNVVHINEWCLQLSFLPPFTDMSFKNIVLYGYLIYCL